MEAYRTAYVYVREAFARALKETDYGYSFKYNEEYLKNQDSTAVSLTLPLREEEYTSNFLFPFFDGLIPETRSPQLDKKSKAAPHNYDSAFAQSEKCGVALS